MSKSTDAFSKEEVDILKEYYLSKTHEEVAEIIYEKLGKIRSVSGIRQKGRRLNLHSGYIDKNTKWAEYMPLSKALVYFQDKTKISKWIIKSFIDRGDIKIQERFVDKRKKDRLFIKHEELFKWEKFFKEHSQFAEKAREFSKKYNVPETMIYHWYESKLIHVRKFNSRHNALWICNQCFEFVCNIMDTTEITTKAAYLANITNKELHTAIKNGELEFTTFNNRVRIYKDSLLNFIKINNERKEIKKNKKVENYNLKLEKIQKRVIRTEIDKEFQIKLDKEKKLNVEKKRYINSINTLLVLIDNRMKYPELKNESFVDILESVNNFLNATNTKYYPLFKYLLTCNIFLNDEPAKIKGKYLNELKIYSENFSVSYKWDDIKILLKTKKKEYRFLTGGKKSND